MCRLALSSTSSLILPSSGATTLGLYCRTLHLETTFRIAILTPGEKLVTSSLDRGTFTPGCGGRGSPEAACRRESKISRIFSCSDASWSLKKQWCFPLKLEEPVERGPAPREMGCLLSKQAVTTETPAIASGHSADVPTLRPFSSFESHAQPIHRPRLEAGLGL